MPIFKKLETEYRKNIQLEPEREVGMYISYIIVCAILFIGFGSSKHLENIRSNMAYIKEIKNAISQKETKLEQIQNLQKGYQEAQQYLPTFNMYMPQQANEQDFLVSFVKEAATYGFVVDNLRAETIDESSTRITATLLGNGAGILEVVQGIESQKRLVKIERVGVFIKPDIVSIAISLIIYNQST